MNKLLPIFAFLLSYTLLSAQVTVGLLDYDATQASEGYNLHFPHNQGSAYLLDNCGEIVHVWEDFNYRPGNGIELATNGLLYACKGRGAISNSYIHAGGGGEKLEVRDWDNNLVWEFVYNDSLHRLHHDLAVMPNGNVLLIAWDRKLEAEAIAAGRDTSFLTEGEVWPDQVIEVQPDGMGGGTIIWQWNAWDHLIQDYDNTKANYGIVADHPELIDLNYGQDGDADWLHANAIDYNPQLDQIVLSIPHFNEVWIIDHSTTTAQAAGHTGGFAGKGGDLIYRWGNPAAYDQGTETDQKLFFQHDAHWIDIGLDGSHPDFGKIAIFNNRVGADFSAATIIAPSFDSYNWAYALIGATYAPADFDWTYTTPIPQDLYSSGLSSLQRLPNGNTLICAGRPGYSIEITPTEEIVWAYKNPMNSGNPVTQGTVLPVSANLHFRMNRYPIDYPAFTGKDLSPKGWIELNPDSTYCDRLVAVEDVVNDLTIRLFPNPASDYLQMEVEGLVSKTLTVEVFDLLGRSVLTKELQSDNQLNIDVKDWEAGIYVVKIGGKALRVLVH